MKKYVITAAVVCLPAAVWAWQGSMAAINLSTQALHSAIEQATRHKGEDTPIVRLGAREIAAARALPETQQVALMRELAAATKAVVMSSAFQSAHDAYIAREYKAADHGLKVKSGDQMLAGVGTDDGNAEFMLKVQRDMAASIIQVMMDSKIDDVRMMFDASVKDWTRDANNARRSAKDRAKYQKLVDGAQKIEGLSATDPVKFRRGYAVLRSAENDGLDTEEALFGGAASAENEAAQLMWDKHNLRGGLKRVLSQIVAEAPTVDFAAATTMKDRTSIFVNPTYEKKSLTWKAMYRAGKAPTAAGVEFAKAWLKEL